MHETSIIQSLIELIREQLAEQGPVRVTSVHLRVGAMAGVVPEALQFAFAAVVLGTSLDGARLDIQAAPLTAWCRVCMTERPIDSPQRLRCPVCDRPTPDVLSGKELELAWLEIVDVNEATYAS
jgi:hydrogenase nickel incorporation protein HypA/HybF